MGGEVVNLTLQFLTGQTEVDNPQNQQGSVNHGLQFLKLKLPEPHCFKFICELSLGNINISSSELSREILRFGFAPAFPTTDIGIIQPPEQIIGQPILFTFIANDNVVRKTHVTIC